MSNNNFFINTNFKIINTKKMVLEKVVELDLIFAKGFRQSTAKANKPSMKSVNLKYEL